MNSATPSGGRKKCLAFTREVSAGPVAVGSFNCCGELAHFLDDIGAAIVVKERFETASDDDRRYAAQYRFQTGLRIASVHQYAGRREKLVHIDFAAKHDGIRNNFSYVLLNGFDIFVGM